MPTGTLLTDPSTTPSMSVDQQKRRGTSGTHRLLMLTLIDDELDHKGMWRDPETVDDGWYG